MTYLVVGQRDAMRLVAAERDREREREGNKVL